MRATTERRRSPSRAVGRRLLVAGGLLALAVAGCEFGSRFPPSDMSFEEFCPQWHALYVALYGRCQDIPPQGLGADSCAQQAARISAGRIGFDRSVATGCLRVWQTATCDQLRSYTFNVCGGLEPGLVAPGGVCLDDDECKGTTIFCDRPASASCPGTCRTRIPVDGDCTANPSGCDLKTACIDTTKGRRCRPRIHGGGACSPTVGACYANLICVATAPGATSTCLATLFPGDACDAAAPACVPYATCSDGGKCVRVPVVDEACGQLGGSYVTCLNAWCDGEQGGAPGTCRALLALGAACERDDQCAGAALCTGGVCAVASCP
jgi:hypothetical protein